MAVFVLMLKEFEDKTGQYISIWIKWEFNGVKNRVINQLSPIASQESADDFFFKRAERRLSRIIIKENQNFVDRTTIESW